MRAGAWRTLRPSPGKVPGSLTITIEGADFAGAYFGIWLGREPIDEKLKRDLLKSR